MSQRRNPSARRTEEEVLVAINLDAEDCPSLLDAIHAGDDALGLAEVIIGGVIKDVLGIVNPSLVVEDDFIANAQAVVDREGPRNRDYVRRWPPNRAMNETTHDDQCLVRWTVRLFLEYR